MSEPENYRKRIGSLFVEKGLIAEPQLEFALEEQKKHNGRLGYWLVRLGFVPAEKLASFLTDHRYVAPVQERIEVRQAAARKLPRSVSFYYKIAPLKLENRVLTVAICEVSHPHLTELLSEITGYQIDALILPEKEIRALIESSYPLPQDPGVEFSAFDQNTFTISDAQKNIKAIAPAQLKPDTEIGERLRSFITEAIKEKSREMIIKPEADYAHIYFKKETLKHSDFVLTPAQHEDMTFLIFQLAKMNLLHQQNPQHGQFVVKIHERKIHMIVRATPTLYGTRLLLEMFDEKVLKHSYEELLKSFPETHKHIEDFLTEQKKGALVITGPEGCGKTRFLYSLLARAKENYHNIHTVENGIRYPLTGIRQNEVAGDQVVRVLEEYLYKAPDLVAIAPLRSLRAAEIVFLLAAKIPVVLLLSSFDAFKAVEWLCGHNLKSAVKAGLVHTVVSPRTIPRICPHCAVPYTGSTDEFEGMNLPAGTQLKMNQGCEHCRNQENWHSESFFESFRIDQEAIDWILKDYSSANLRRSARSAGRSTLYDLVVRDAFSDHLDMLSVAKLHAVL